MKFKSSSTSRILKVHNGTFLIGLLLTIVLFWQGDASARIFIDINAPSIQKIKIAIPDFRNLSREGENPELASELAGVVANDLEMSGYFSSMDKSAFLAEDKDALTQEEIHFKDWSVIGADLLLKAGYTCIGESVELEVRLFDVFWGRQILGKRFLGKAKQYRTLMHRVGNAIIKRLTGNQGIFLTKLAFVGTATGHKEIYVCDYDGYNLKRITFDRNIALLPRWSPKGDKLFYNSYRGGKGPVLYLKDMVSGRVKTVSARKGLNIGACWAPDGKSAALTLSEGDNPDIYSIDLEGNILRRLTNHWGIDVSPAFSPDGTKIAFVSNRSGSPQIYVRDLKKGTEKRLTFEGNYNTSPAWSSLNRIVYAGGEEGDRNIYTVSPDGSNLRKLTENQQNNEDPCWSANGRYIAFSSNRDGAYHIYIMNANGQNQTKITSFKGEQTSPSWSP
ncbi:MAG: Tol-Pal system beta propeller repeat protein TolB [Deltaproteobacteria bacterium]|nr:Tol-Pal system beta propeller repeat protein TolB [Deltaproteobacteria bacterium]MBW2298742.1 Tol-Pal system beta propeller repeat protein TolB [Deltaproteobacteria bacterium]